MNCDYFYRVSFVVWKKWCVVVRCPHTAMFLLMDGLTLLCFQHTDARSA